MWGVFSNTLIVPVCQDKLYTLFGSGYLLVYEFVLQVHCLGLCRTWVLLPFSFRSIKASGEFLYVSVGTQKPQMNQMKCHKPSNVLSFVQVKYLMANSLQTKNLLNLHLVAGEISSEALKKVDVFYTLTGKSAETDTSVSNRTLRGTAGRRWVVQMQEDVM